MRRSEPLKEGDRILVNQAGYNRYLPSRALVELQAPPTDQFVIGADLVDSATGRTIVDLASNHIPVEYEGKFYLEIKLGDVRRPGKYQIRSGPIVSPIFEIAADTYTIVAQDVMHAFYLQRCGTEVNDNDTGLSHKACHKVRARLARKDAFHNSGERFDVSGGWHDAGDYGRYVASTAVAVGQILGLYERDPERYVRAVYGIPGSGNAVPDLIEEMSVGVRWLLKMQRKDGAFYRKVAPAKWPAFPVKPDEDRSDLVLYGVSTHATALAVAALAVAARVLPHWDNDLAVRSGDAAAKGWGWVSQHSPYIDHDPEDDEGSGRYFGRDEDGTLMDANARLWAAIELSLLEGSLAPLIPFEQQWADRKLTSDSWSDPVSLGALSLARLDDLDDVDDFLTWRVSARSKILALAYESLDAASTPFAVSDAVSVWGGTRTTAQTGLVLAMGARLTGDKNLLRGATRHADYLFGVGPLGLAFITGHGFNQPKKVHHRWFAAEGARVPGLMVGGPNEKADDKVTPLGLGLKSYIDDPRAFSSNEFAIDHNAALFGLLMELNAATPEPGFWQRMVDSISG